MISSTEALIPNDKRTLRIVLKIGIKRKELEPNHDLSIEPTRSVLNPRTKENSQRKKKEVS